MTQADSKEAEGYQGPYSQSKLRDLDADYDGDDQTIVDKSDYHGTPEEYESDGEFSNELKSYDRPAEANYNIERGSLEGSTIVDGGHHTNESVILNAEGNSRSLQRSALDSSHDQQLYFNDKRILLARSLFSGINIIQHLRHKNIEHPVFYPSSALEDETNNIMLNNNNSRLALDQKKLDKKSLKQPLSTADSVECDHKFEILKINVKIDPATGNNVISTLDKSAISLLLNQKMISTIRHLNSLKDRLDDTTSKVLVTGDLNSGKSAFCNALMRRKILPEDQQPCTNVFCEIIDAKENKGIEEVHAIRIGKKYDLQDESSFEIHKLNELEDLVHKSEIYSWLYIYANDNRPEDYSLLKNGVIDIRFIDAPGLNLDSYQTTQLFSRQEEIDLIVFVVSAENYFTLSGREFISTATNDKNLIFMVVNKFDQIENKEKCKQKIMDQVKTLSPETYKGASEFVHFVSSSSVFENDDKDNNNDDGDNNDDPNSDDYNPDFDHLEASLRRFVLEKRSISKLLPAKNYLVKLYNDLSSLSKFNEEVYKKDAAKANADLRDINPKYEKNMQSSSMITEKVNRLIEETSNTVYNYTRNAILSTLDTLDTVQLVDFSKSETVGQFAENTQQTLLDKIMESIDVSEEFARERTSSAVSEIQKVGIDLVGEDKFSNTEFVASSMYTNRRHDIQRHLDNDISISDFIDPNFESFCQLYGIRLPNPKLINQLLLSSRQLWTTGITGIAIVYGPKFVSVSTSALSITGYIPTWVWKNVVLASLGIGMILVPGYYFYRDAPYAYQRNVVKKIKKKIEASDYSHVNSHRIAKECRKVLQYPLMDVSNAVQSLVEDTATKRKKVLDELESCKSNIKFYTNLSLEIEEKQKMVENCIIEA